MTPTDGGGPDEPWPSPARRRPNPPTADIRAGTDPPTDSARRSADPPIRPHRFGAAVQPNRPPNRSHGVEGPLVVRRRGGNGPGSAPTGPAADAAPGRSSASSPSSSSRSSWRVAGSSGSSTRPAVRAPASPSRSSPGGAQGGRRRAAARGVIGSSLAFQVWEKVSGAGSFQAGTYQLHESMGVSDASDALARGPSTAAASSGDHTVLALPPGLRLEQIADRVGALPGHDRAAFLALAQSGQIRSQLPGRPDLGRGLHVARHLLRRAARPTPQILQTIVSEFDQSCRRGEPRRRTLASGSRRSRRWWTRR